MSKKIKAKVGLPDDPKIVELEIADRELPVWDLDYKPSLVGKDIPRMDGQDKVLGRAKYTYDVGPQDLPGLLYGKILRSVYPHARVESIDASKALALPGVKAVITLDKGEGFNAEQLLSVMSEDPNRPPAGRTVLFQGEEIAAVAAESEEIAEDALKLFEVKYRRLPFVVDHEEAMRPSAPRVHKGETTNLAGGKPEVKEQGNVAQAFKDPDLVIYEGTFRTPVVLHNCLETHGCVAKWEGDKLKVWASTQGVFGFRDDLAKIFNIPAHNVQVMTEHMGGGFGSKFGAMQYGPLAVALAKKSGRPVKLMYDRHEENLASGNRPSATMHIKIAAKKDGTLHAIDFQSYGTAGVGTGAGTSGPIWMTYKCPNVRTEEGDVFTNAGFGMPFRAPGFPQGSFALDQAMDELAGMLNLDPLDFRRKNFVGQPYLPLEIMYKLGAEKIGWNQRNARAGAGTGLVKRGIGMATGVWGNYGEPPAQAMVRIHPDGTIEAVIGTQDIGTGTRTIVGVIAAEELGVPLETVKVNIGDTTSGLTSPASGGSMTLTSIGPAVRQAAFDAKQKLFKLAAPALKTQPEELESRDGKIFVKSNPARSLPWARVAAKMGTTPIAGHGEREQNLKGYDQPAWAVQFVDVSVDTETGLVKVNKVVSVAESGRVIDRLTFESQVNGGTIMGLSYGLLERRTMDRLEGRVMNPNLEDYKILGPQEMPEIEAVIIDDVTPYNSLGSKGLGEPPVVPTAAALANAVANALGVRLFELPLTPDHVLDALTAQKEG